MSSLTQKIFTKGNTAVITGASSGIGRAAAAMCASKGMNVYMADIDADDLTRAAEYVQTSRTDAADVHTIVTDVSQPSSVQALCEKVKGNNHKVHFLMNNAGVGLGGGAMTDFSLFEKVMGVNTYGPIHGCQTFVPYMKEGGEDGLIVTTGSKQGITAPPGNLVYNMSKAAVKCYAEGLEHELRGERQESGGKLHSALLIPGWVNTSIVLKQKRDEALLQNKDFDIEKDVFFHEDKPAAGAWMPQQVIEFMLRELDQGRFYILCPDNDVDRETDNCRMAWTMGDIIENRPPLSRWHPEYTEKFGVFLEESKKK